MEHAVAILNFVDSKNEVHQRFMVIPEDHEDTMMAKLFADFKAGEDYLHNLESHKHSPKG